MTIGNVNPDFPVGTNMDQFDVGLLALGTTSSETPTSFIVTIGQEQLAFGGSNLTFGSQGQLTGGSIIAIQDEYQGEVEFNMSGFSISATSLQAWANADDNTSLNNALFSGADTLTGGPQSDLLHGYGGGDSISGGGGNDTLIGGPGNETLNGGPGTDVITTGGGTDVIIVGLHESGITQATADIITDWSSADVLAFAHGPSGPSDLVEITSTDFATAANIASHQFAEGSVHIVAAAIGSDVVIFADSGNDNTLDDAVILKGATLSEVSINNFTLSGSSGSSGSPTSPPPPASPPPPPPPPPPPSAPTSLALDPSADSGTKGDGITNVAKVVVDGVAAPGTTVTLLDGSTVVGTATANATTGAFSVTATSALSDGAHTLNVQATDAAGNVSPSASLNVTVDTTAPVAPSGLVLDPSADSGTKGDGITNVAMVVVDGVAQPGVTVTLLDGSTVVGTATANATTGAFSVAAKSALSDGAHTLNVEATDAAGNVSPSASLNVTVDTRPPAAPTGLTLDAAADSGTKGDGITNVAMVVVDGVAQPGVTVTLLDGSTVVGTAKANATTGAFSVTPSSALSDGAHILNVVATDAAGNVSPSASLNVTIDTAPPAAPSGLILDPSADSGIKGDGITNVAMVVVDGVAQPGATVTLLDGSTVVGAATANATTGAFSVAATSALSDGVHTLNVQATDTAGNVSPSASLNVTVDTRPPAAPTGLVLDAAADSGTKGDGITDIAKVVVDGVTEHATTVTLLDGSTIVGTSTVNATTGAFSVAAASALSVGAHTLNVETSDAAGNVSPAASLSVTIDTAPPAAPSGLVLDPSADSGTKGDDITNVAMVIVDGVAQPGVAVTLLDGSTVVGTATANATTGAFSVAATSALSDGVHTLNVEAIDAAGDVGPSASLSVTVDTRPPAAPTGLTLDAGADSGTKGDGITDIAKVVVDGVTEHATTVTLLDGSTVVGTASVNATTGAFSVAATSALSVGAHTLNIQASDAAGNIGLPTSLNVTVDAPPVAPTGLILDPSADTGTKGDGTTNVAKVVVDGVAAQGATVTLLDGSTVVGTATANATTGAFSVAATSALSDGVHTLNVQATDAAGDVGPSASLNVTVDTKPPAAPTGLTLDPTADSGTKGDRVTDVAKVIIDGVAAQGATVSLFDGSTLVGTATANATTGAFSVAATSTLSDGAHTLNVQATDVAGNVGPSSSINVLIDTHPIGASIGGLTETTSGNKTTVVITGSEADATSTVGLFEDGASIGSVKPTNGVWSFTTPNLSNTIHTFTTQTTDAAGDVAQGATTLILGSSGTDKIVAGAGNVIIDGGGGVDTLTAGSGADVFVYNTLSNAPVPKNGGSSVATINNFQSAIDKLDLTHLGSMTYHGESTSVSSHEVSWYVSNGNTYLVGDADGSGRADFTVELTGVHTLTAADFLLA